MKDTLSRLYRLQVLADQLRTTNRRKTELEDLRQLNHRDYDALHRLLKQQSAGLDEALRLKMTIYREMNNGCSHISKIRKAQSLQTKKIDFRSEVLLDKRLTSSQNTLTIKFRELNQLLWQLGEPLHHPTYLHAHLSGFLEIQELLEVERDLQMSFAGYDISAKATRSGETVEAYLQRRCADGALLVKKIGGAGRFNTFLLLSESECGALVEDGYQNLISEDQKLLESKLTPVEDKRVIRDRLQAIQAHFDACARSFSKLRDSEPRPKNYDEVLQDASSLSHGELRDLLKSHLPFTAAGRPDLGEPILTDQFDVDFAINPQGFLQIFQEKYDRLTQLRLKMDRVEELQERELHTEEAKVSHKTEMQERLGAELASTPEGRRQYRRFNKILEARDNCAVSYIKRPASRLNNPFSYEDEYFCSGCNVVISTAKHQKVKRLTEIESCDSCNRILVPFAHVTYEKEEVDPLLISEEDRIAMEESGALGLIPACSNCGSELYEDKELKLELDPSPLLTSICVGCHSIVVPLNLDRDEATGETETLLGVSESTEVVETPEEEA